MKKNFKPFSIGITLILLSLLSCKKNHEVGDVLPPVTSIGANTFGCILDEKVFAAIIKCNHSFGIHLYTPPCVSVSLSNSGFILEAESEKYIEQQITKIFISANTDTNFTQILQIYNNSSININKGNSFEHYSLDTTQQNELKIIKKRYADISGSFTLHFINTTGQRKVLKDGRFDVQF